MYPFLTNTAMPSGNGFYTLGFIDIGGCYKSHFFGTMVPLICTVRKCTGSPIWHHPCTYHRARILMSDKKHNHVCIHSKNGYKFLVISETGIPSATCKKVHYCTTWTGTMDIIHQNLSTEQNPWPIVDLTTRHSTIHTGCKHSRFI
jgi:hypothetical protein